jgi:hypothetical protein
MEHLDPTEIPLKPRPPGCTVPLTAWQQRVWNHFAKRGKPLSVRMCAASVRLLGPLDICLLRRSIEAIVQRHEALRTTIVLVDGVPTQHVNTAYDDHVSVVDLTEAPSRNIEADSKRLAQEFIDEEIDLSAGPLFAAKLLRQSDRDHVLVLALDHIVSDAVSYLILGREIWTLYNQGAQGQPFSLPLLPVQFADYAVWQQQTNDSWLKKHEAYWRERLAGAPSIQIPLDNNAAEVEYPTGATLHFPFGNTLSAKLRDLARRERTLLPLVVLTAYAVVMSRWLRQTDLVLVFGSHGRYRRPELENMIGFLAYGLHFRLEVTRHSSFLDLLRRATLEFYAASNHEDFGRVPDLIPECTTELIFNWLPANWVRRSVHQEGRAHEQVRTQPFQIDTVGSAHKFMLFVSDSPAGIIATVQYRSDLFGSSTIERLGNNLRLLSAEFAQHPLASLESAPSTP